MKDLMSETNKTFATLWFEKVWNEGRRDAIVEMLAPDGVIHDGHEILTGPDGFYSFFDRMHAAFSDIHITIESALAEGDDVCLRWSCTMRHSGDGLGLPATGKVVKTTGISIIRLANGKLAEGWQNWDMLGLIQQITEAPRSRTYIAAQ
jgi:steroid delta-isomerase-like uncharacterized protein